MCVERHVEYVGQSMPYIHQKIDSRKLIPGLSVTSGKGYTVNKLCEANFIVLIALDRKFPWSVPVMQ